MNTREKLILAIIVLVYFAFTGMEGKQTTGWKGKIEYEDGVKTVKNPEQPLYGELEFVLEEDLSIGREGDENYMFYSGIGLALDSQDNIYALDYGNSRIQKYNKEGQYLQTIGRKGQGPGEFEFPFKFFLDRQDNIYVYDRRKFKIFNNKGEFLKSVKLRTFIDDFYVSPEGSIFALSELRDEKGSKQAVVKIDTEGEIVEKVAEFPYVELIIRKSAGGVYSFGVSRHEYIPVLCFSAISDQTFCYAHSSEYKIFIVDKSGKILLVFHREESPQTVRRKEKDFILDRMKEIFKKRGRDLPKGVLEEVQFPSSRPFFDHLMSDNKQRLYVRRLKSVLDKSDDIEFDIFSKEGVYLYKTKLPFTPRIIKNGFIYKVETNEETGETKIKRFKVGNWEQIKDGRSQ
jgi:hypothetical protein